MILIGYSTAIAVGSITFTQLAQSSSGSTATVYNLTPNWTGHGGKTVAALICVGMTGGNTLESVPSSVTLGGATATMRAGGWTGSTGQENVGGSVSIWTATLGGSPTNTAVVTCPISATACALNPYVIDGANVVPHSSFLVDTGGSAGTSLASSLDTPTNGVVLAGTVSRDTARTTTLTGAAAFTETDDGSFDQNSHACYHREGGPYSSETVTATFSGSSYHQLVAASFAPA